MENQTKEIVKINPAEYGLDESKAMEVESVFLPVVAERDNLAITYNEIVNKEISTDLVFQARELRLKLVKVRTNTDKIHKTAKAFYLAGGRFVDAWKNKNVEVISQMEEKLSGIENYYANIEKEKLDNLEKERIIILSEFVPNPESYPVRIMTEEAFSNLIDGQKLIKKQKEEEAKRIEAERIAEEKAEKEEQERIRLENEKLKAEAIEREKAEKIEREKQAKILAEQKAKAEAEAKKAKEIADAKLKAEQEKAAIEKAKADKLAAELKAKAEAEAKEKARIEKEKKDKIEAEKKALKAPDKSKILSLCIQIENITYPAVNSNEAKEIIEKVKNLFGKVTDFIKEESENL